MTFLLKSIETTKYQHSKLTFKSYIIKALISSGYLACKSNIAGAWRIIFSMREAAQIRCEFLGSRAICYTDT